MTSDTASLLLRRCLTGFGTEVEIRLWPDAARMDEAEAALDRAVRFLRAAEARLSRFRPDSDVARLNRAAGAPVHVSRLTLDLVAAALVAAGATGGLFDPTVHAALVAAGYDRSFEQLGVSTTKGARPPHVQAGRYREVEVDPRSRTVRVPAGAGLDLGGIAKGWLADAVVRRLRRYGAAMADLGGDMSFAGRPPDANAWEIDVADPRDGSLTLGRLRLAEGGIATSGVLRRRWVTDAGPRHHIIDPRTGRSAVTDLAAVTVAAPSAAAAEVAAKAVLLLGAEAGSTALALSDELAGVLVLVCGPLQVAGAFEPAGIEWEPEP